MLQITLEQNQTQHAETRVRPLQTDIRMCFLKNTYQGLRNCILYFFSHVSSIFNLPRLAHIVKYNCSQELVFIKSMWALRPVSDIEQLTVVKTFFCLLGKDKLLFHHDTVLIQKHLIPVICGAHNLFANVF